MRLVKCLILSSAVVALPLKAQRSSYFPPDYSKPQLNCGYASGPKPIINDLEDKWYSGHLKAAKELPLYNSANRHSVDIIRFTWLRSFHKPIFIRIEWNRSSPAVMIAKELSGAGGYAPGNFGRHIKRLLSREEARRLAHLVRTTQAFKVPVKCDLGMDGAQWILEGVGGDGYKIAVRWSPKDGDVRAIGEMLIALTSWNVGDIY